jgi:hypothetical protein
VGLCGDTFALTDVAPSDVRASYNLLLGTKYQPVLFFMFVYKNKFQSPKHLFFIPNLPDVLMI